jgi:hypothetical protein
VQQSIIASISYNFYANANTRWDTAFAKSFF